MSGDGVVRKSVFMRGPLSKRSGCVGSNNNTMFSETEQALYRSPRLSQLTSSRTTCCCCCCRTGAD